MRDLRKLRGRRRRDRRRVVGENDLKLPTKVKGSEINNEVDSRSNGSAYNKNPSFTTLLFVPMELFLLSYIMAITTFHSNNKFH